MDDDSSITMKHMSPSKRTFAILVSRANFRNRSSRPGVRFAAAPTDSSSVVASRRGAEDRLDLLIRSCQRAACSYTGGPAALGLGSTAPCCAAGYLSKWVTHRLPPARFWLTVMTLTADVVCCNWRVLAGKLNNGYTLAFPPGEAGEW